MIIMTKLDLTSNLFGLDWMMMMTTTFLLFHLHIFFESYIQQPNFIQQAKFVSNLSLSSSPDPDDNSFNQVLYPIKFDNV